MVNYKHLHYFWVAAKEACMARAIQQLSITPQIISSQATLLETYFGNAFFQKYDPNIKPTESGRFALHFYRQNSLTRQ